MKAWVLVPRECIKDDHLSPSSIELYDSMTLITTCREAISHWHPDWTRCPVCLGDMDGISPQIHYKVALN